MVDTSRLEMITESPPNAGVRLTSLRTGSLSQAEMYLRCNFEIPERAPDSFEIRMPGRETRFLSAGDLESMGPIETDLVLECAGNGRTLMSPAPGGTPWGLGGVSPIRVTGVPLSVVLGDLPADVTEVVFTGADHGEVEPEGKVPYQFSLQRELALSTTPLLATHIGGEPLTLDHGAPVRLIVPGQYAMKSVKWLTSIEGVDEPFHGHFVRKYRYYGDDIASEEEPVGSIAVRSLITSPAAGDTVRGPVLPVRGIAWTGTGRIDLVEVSADGGMSWSQAKLDSSQNETAPISWATELTVLAGTPSLMARAGDTAGNTQPLEPRWNSNGYANNVVHRVQVTVTSRTDTP